MNATWNVIELKGTNVTKFKPNCKIETPEKKVSGNTGCNFYGADLTLDENKHTIAFLAVIQTKIGCLNEVAIFESNYINALNDISQYEFEDLNTLLLKDSKGVTLVKLTKTP